MLNYAIAQEEHSIAIKVPHMGVVSTGVADDTDYSLLKSKVVKKGQDVAIIAVEDFFPIGEENINHLYEYGIDVTLHTELLAKLRNHHSLIITLEDGVKDGEYRQKVALYYGLSHMRVKN